MTPAQNALALLSLAARLLSPAQAAADTCSGQQGSCTQEPTSAAGATPQGHACAVPAGHSDQGPFLSQDFTEARDHVMVDSPDEWSVVAGPLQALFAEASSLMEAGGCYSKRGENPRWSAPAVLGLPTDTTRWLHVGGWQRRQLAHPWIEESIVNDSPFFDTLHRRESCLRVEHSQATPGQPRAIAQRVVATQTPGPQVTDHLSLWIYDDAGQLLVEAWFYTGSGPEEADPGTQGGVRRFRWTDGCIDRVEGIWGVRLGQWTGTAPIGVSVATPQ